MYIPHQISLCLYRNSTTLYEIYFRVFFNCILYDINNEIVTTDKNCVVLDLNENKITKEDKYNKKKTKLNYINIKID